MTVARTNNGSRMKTNNLVPSRTVPKPGRRGPFRRRLHQALRLSHPRQFSVRPCVTAHPWISTSWSAPAQSTSWSSIPATVRSYLNLASYFDLKKSGCVEQ
jgi:hypothetical protein